MASFFASAAPSSGDDFFHVWLFVDRLVFAGASGLEGVDLETRWSRLWLSAVGLGQAWGPSARRPRALPRVAFELEILCPSRDDRVWPTSVRAACGSRLPVAGLSLRVAGGPRADSLVLYLTRELLGRGSNFGDRELSTAWARLWVVASQRGAVVAGARRPTVRMEVVERSSA